MTAKVYIFLTGTDLYTFVLKSVFGALIFNLSILGGYVAYISLCLSLDGHWSRLDNFIKRLYNIEK